MSRDKEKAFAKIQCPIVKKRRKEEVTSNTGELNLIKCFCYKPTVNTASNTSGDSEMRPVSPPSTLLSTASESL